jgi:manganese/zinc/iron transport system substrate-binding protein
MITKFLNISSRFASFGLIFFLSSLISGCNAPKKSGSLVVTTTGMLADAARNLLPDSIRVEGLMGPGVDPHLYKARQRDIALFREADLIVFNGLHLEGKLTEVLHEMGDRTVAITEKLPDSLLIAATASGGVHDPHIWQDPVLWHQVIDSLSIELQNHFPASKTAIQINHARYAAEIDSLHLFATSELARIPAEQRVLVTAHDAFSYFGKRYAIEIHALQGISTVAEFGLKDITDLVELVSSRKIKAIFVESSISPRSIESVLTGCREKGHAVNLGGTLYSDALGTSGTPEATYIGMMKANITTIASGLRE